MKKKLNQWSGDLPLELIAKGMTAASQNARRLADDAKLLLEANRFPSAAALAILAIEESGKHSILRSMTMARNEEEWKACWKDFRSHTKKNILWTFFDLVRKGARKLDDFAKILDPSSDHPYVLDQLKQLAIYTDCLGDRKWSLPTDVVDKGLASSLCLIANLMCTDKDTTLLELQLWVKHMGPVWKNSKEAMDAALVAWHEEMQEVGLYDPGPNRAAQFLKGFPLPDREA